MGLRAAAGLPVGLLQFLSRTLGLDFDEILTGPPVNSRTSATTYASKQRSASRKPGPE